MTTRASPEYRGSELVSRTLTAPPDERTLIVALPDVAGPLATAAPPAHELACRALRRRFRGRAVVDGVSLTIRSGEIVGLLGPNGAGKTVTFSMIAGLLGPSGGEVLLDGRDITRLSMHERAGRGVTYLPQERSVFGGLSALDNVAGILEYRGLSRRLARGRAMELLEEFGIAALADVRAGRLSGGEQRRLEVARAVSTDPNFLLLDEPFAGVDPITVETIHGLLDGLRERGIGVLLTDHNVREAFRLARRAYVLFDGRVLAEGTAETLAADPAVRRHFLGDGEMNR